MALNKQIDRAERMAEKFAPDEIDNINNKWWKKVNDLINKQEMVIAKMANVNTNALDITQGGIKRTQTSNLDITIHKKMTLK